MTSPSSKSFKFLLFTTIKFMKKEDGAQVKNIKVHK